MKTKKLFRNTNTKMIAGVASGVADYFEIDRTIIRILFVIAFLSPILFPVGLFYIILWIIIPKNSLDFETFNSTSTQETNY